MKKYLLHIILFFCFVQQFHAQEGGVVAFELPVRNSLKFNRYAINPTFSFVREQNKYISFTNKRQWVQFDNAPQTYLFSYAGRFRENIGAGVSVFQQNYGVLTTFGGVLNFAYNAVLGRDSNLTFGMNLGVYKSGLNTGKVITNFDDSSLNNIPSNTMFTVNPGINYGTGFIDFGVSINNLVSYNLQTSKIIEDNPEQSIQGHIMYTGYLNSRGFFDESKFSGLVRSEFKKEKTVISGIMMLTVPKGIWAQAGYNTLYGVSAGIGLNITNQISLEYNYEKAIGDLSAYGNSHEVTLAYKFKNVFRYDYSGDDDEQAVFNSTKKSRRVFAKSKPSTEERVDRAAIAEAKEQAKVDAAEKLKAKLEARAKLVAEAKAKREAKIKAVNDVKSIAKSSEETQTKLKLEEQTRIEAENKKQLEAETKLKSEEAARAKLALEKQTQAEEVTKRKLEQEAAETKLKEEEQARLKEENRQRLAEEAKAKAEEAARIKLASEQAKAKEIAKRKLEQAVAEAKLKEEEQARIKEENRQRLAAEAKAKAEEAARIKLALEQAKAKEIAKRKLEQAAAEAKLKEEEQARLKEANRQRLAAEAKAKEEEAARIKLAEEIAQRKLAKEEAEMKLKLEEQSRLEEEKKQQLAKQKLAEEQLKLRLEEESRRKEIAEQKADTLELEGLLVKVAKDRESLAIKGLIELTEQSKIEQQDLLIKLRETLASKQQDLDDLKEENDLSEQGIVSKPKPFKSVSAENRALEVLKEDLNILIKSQDLKISELESLYNERLKIVNDKTEVTNVIYQNKIQELKSNQSKLTQTRASLLETLNAVKVATEIERKRRIKRAAYDNEEDRYKKDKATLNQIKKYTPLSSVPLGESDFDFGEELNNNIKIVKAVSNEDSGYYLVIAVHSDTSKRDEFLRKAVAAGQSNINFFYDVNTSKYYIYYDKFDYIDAAKKAIDSKENKPYNSKMSLVKIEN
ncbi:PorP/SprF family type IX secretion system membrane protein [Thalassobellus suaedae]|uniref:PorP/SprF family type IX secretion system membrane protein n=1 Tax=Thalassobellus suaedae TaxID=3074124 RepID=A0ABY9Y2J8_9FLAO|nr:PorP/SprF family type IX secretion system membrane protein [Flavobacteriaceae bacterium HL-DH10]